MKTDSSKSTILVISMGFIGIYLVFGLHWAVYVAFVIGVIGILSVFVSQKIEWIWMKLAKILEYIIPNILLGIVFYVFLFPISLLSKIFSKDPLMLSKNYKSYFVDVKKKSEKSNMEKIW